MEKLRLVERIQLKMKAVKLLKFMIELHGYNKISEALGLPQSVISRYINGHVLPRWSRTLEILELSRRMFSLSSLIKKRIIIDENGYIDNTRILGDTDLLSLIADYVYDLYKDEGITKILTAAVDGIPLATLIAERFGVGLAIAKKEKEIGVKKFYEEVLILPDSGLTIGFYLPRRALSKRDRVLIVDDLIRSGWTQKVLINFVKKVGASLVGIFVILVIGDDWRRNLSIEEDLVRFLLKL